MNRYNLFVGPMSPPIHGQNTCFNYAISNCSGLKKIIDTQKYSSKWLNIAWVNLSAIFYLLTHRFGKIYITGSRTFQGVIKELTIFWLGSWLGIPIINHIHGNELIKLSSKKISLRDFILIKTIQRSSSIIVLNESFELPKYFENVNRYVVENFVHHDFDEELELKRELICCYYSNLMASKGILDFLTIADRALRLGLNLRFEIAGSLLGDSIMNKSELTTKITFNLLELEKKYPGKVTYYGAISGKDRNALLRRSSFMIFPSYYPTEAFPLSVIEAMYCGTIVIARKHNYIDELIVDNENGYLIDGVNTERYCDLLSDLIENVELRRKLSERAHIYASNRYSRSKYINNLNEILLT